MWTAFEFSSAFVEISPRLCQQSSPASLEILNIKTNWSLWTKEYKETSKWQKKKKCQSDECPSAETVFSPRDSFKIKVILSIIDNIAAALKARLNAYKDIEDIFGVLFNLIILYNYWWYWKSSTYIDRIIFNEFEDCFPSELVQFSELFKSISLQAQDEEKTQGMNPELRMLLLLNENKYTWSFPNVHIAPHIYLSMALLLYKCALFITLQTGSLIFKRWVVHLMVQMAHQHSNTCRHF